MFRELLPSPLPTSIDEKFFSWRLVILSHSRRRINITLKIYISKEKKKILCNLILNPGRDNGFPMTPRPLVVNDHDHVQTYLRIEQIANWHFEKKKRSYKNCLNVSINTGK